MCDVQKRKELYDFMVKASEEFIKDTDIIQMVYSRGKYSIKYIADKDNYGIFSIYGCDDDGNKQSKFPLCTGNADEIVKYLNDKDNIDNVMQSIPEIE